MKAGVAISPRRIRIVPARALPSVAAMEKEKRSLRIRHSSESWNLPFFFPSPRPPRLRAQYVWFARRRGGRGGKAVRFQLSLE